MRDVAPEFFYDDIADRFEGLDHPADVRRRLRIVFDECLADRSLAGKRTLDAGCGYGPFSAWAAARGAEVVSLDIGHRLVARTMARVGSRGVVADACHLAVRDESFDVVVSSEMIEHTHAPVRAVAELARVLRVDGVLVLTTPNRVWQAAVRGASMLRLRPFRGLENFVAWGELEHACGAAGLDVVGHLGFHPWPFQLGCAGAAMRVERYLARGSLGKLMVNQALIAQKRRRTASASPGI
jgi:2-polyprenyl-3-methyl-5-hydroxy-6-metoxy-1,4-benzoquinol methylase